MSTSQRQSAPAPVQAQGSCPTRRRQQQKNVEVPFQPPEGYKWAPILIPEDQSEPPYSLEEVVPSNYTIWEPQSYLRHEGLSHDTKSMLYPLVDRVREAIRDSGKKP